MPLGTRQAILDATRRLSVEDGFRSLTMRRVAAEVGITAPALYRHFEGKAELIEALLEDARDAFLAALERSAAGATARERLRLAAEAYLRFALERPDAYELLMLTPNQLGLFGMPASLERWKREPPPAFQVCVERVAACMRSGDLAAGDPAEVALSLSGLAHGLVTLYLAGRFGDDEAAFAELYHRSLDHLYRGLESPGA